MRKNTNWYFFLSLLLLVLCASPGRFISVDARTRLLVSKYLWEHGTVAIPAEKEGDVAAQLINPKGNGEWVSYFGIGQSLAFIPFDVLGSLLSPPSERFSKWRENIRELPLVFLYPLCVTFFLAWALFQIAKEHHFSNQSARRGVFFFLTSSILFIYLSQTLQEESIVALFLALAWLRLLRWVREHKKRDAFLCGLFAGTCLLFRLNAIFGLFSLAVLFFEELFSAHVKKRKLILGALPFAVLGVLICLAIHMFFAYLRFASPFETGYAYMLEHGTFLNHPQHSQGGVRPFVALQLLFGLGKGVFILSPILLLTFFAMKRLCTQRPIFWASVWSMLIVSALFHSRFKAFPDGSECWGSRYQVHLLVFFVIPFITVFSSSLRRRLCWGRGVVMGVITAGMLVQIVALTAPDGFDYAEAMEFRGGNESLLASGKAGQLPSRLIKNGDWLSHGVLSFYPPDTSNSYLLEHSNDKKFVFYLPNVWGASYSKHFGGGLATTLVLCLWGSLLFLATILSVIFHRSK